MIPTPGTDPRVDLTILVAALMFVFRPCSEQDAYNRAEDFVRETEKRFGGKEK